MKNHIKLTLFAILLLSCSKPKKQNPKQITIVAVTNLIHSLYSSLKETKEEIKTEKTSSVIQESSFNLLEEGPIYPTCEDEISAKYRKICFQKKLNNFINKNFNADLAQELGLDPGRKRIMVQFKIDQDGHLTDIYAKAPHPALKREAIRIVKQLPKMIPAKRKGKPVIVKYALPINFVVE